MALQSPSSSSSFSYGFTYDVFLSFRGMDTRFGFTGNLYKALCDSGIHTFIDDREIQGGDEISLSLIKAIEESRIFIPVFSINYASSSFCLDELVHIIKCFNTKGCLVLPVFYGVDPSHIRHQTESFGEAIAKQEVKFKNHKDRLLKWKKALNKAANFSGHYFNLGNEYEYELITKIVKEVSNKINRSPLHVADYPVGIESQLLQINSLIDVGSNDAACIVGIYGIGGSGKTTLAKAIYNFIADQFECLCFLHNVREISAKHGLEDLQEKLLSKTVGLSIKFGHVSEGIPIIKERLQLKKVLLILDDVDELKQLQVLVGDPNWLGHGSRVVVTTRDKHLLACHGIERTYEVDGLNKEEALELLKWKAFKNNKVDSSYEHILNRVVTYASGLPLALEVVGSSLFGKHKDEWKSTLDRYERIPHKEVLKILKVSFDSLEKDEQSVFLDIACCFRGYILAEVEDILYAHYGECMKYHIRVLIEKSLIKIYRQCGRTYVTLHDLIEEMGKEIVRQKSPKEPGKRSRLWFHKDIVHVLEENLGTSKIEIIYMESPLSKEEEVVEWKGDELKKMENLKTFIIKRGCFSKGLEHVPNNLRVLEWRSYPSRDSPSNFWQKKLSICKLRESCFTSFELCDSLKIFVNMRELNLDHCQCLIRIHNVFGLPNLESFSFQFCKNLITVHDSVGLLNKLKILNAKRCSKLTSFPPMNLTSLQELELSYCTSLKSFPEILGEMKNITQILLRGTSIEELPYSFQNLSGLQKLLIWGSRIVRLPYSILMMPNLARIEAYGCLLFPNDNYKLSSTVFLSVQFLRCKLSVEFLPIVLSRIANVRDLILSGSDFTILPECLKECHFLMSLELDYCKFLQEIRGIPPNLKHVSALCCESLTYLCRWKLLNQELHEAGSTDFRLAGTATIPEWFEHQCKGPSITFWFREKFPSIAIFFATKSLDTKLRDSNFLSLRVNGVAWALDHRWKRTNRYHSTLIEVKPDHTYLFDLKLQDKELNYNLDKTLVKDEWIRVEVTSDGSMMKSLLTKYGIHVFKQKSSMNDIRFTDPYKLNFEVVQPSWIENQSHESHVGGKS